MCFFSKSSRYLVSVNPVANLLRISAVPAVFSVSSVFHQFYEVFYSRIEQCRLLHTFSGSKFPTQFLNFSSNFKNPAYKFQISAQISNFRTKFLVPSTKFHRVTDPSSSIYVNRQSMTSESHIASIEYRATIVVRSFICECDVALEQYRIHQYTQVHTSIRRYTSVYTNIHRYTPIYTGIHHYTQVYTSIH